jgi:hypothetical protein
MREFSQTILNSIHDNDDYMEESTSGVLRHQHTKVKAYTRAYLSGAYL